MFLTSWLDSIKRRLSTPARARASRRSNRKPRSAVARAERLEDRTLLTVLFADSFEQGEWNGQWIEDAQNDWFDSTQRSTDGSFSAEVDGNANDATLTMTTPIDLSGITSPELTFDWLIENGFDGGEYLALDVSSNGGSTWQTDVRRLDGNVDAENTWHAETVDLLPYASSNLLIRFRSKVNKSNEDANVDNVQITADDALPALSIDDVQQLEGDSGTTAFVFTVTRAGDTSGVSSVDWSTVDGTAQAGTDYVGASGTVQFLAGETENTIAIEVNGDSDIEPDESFTIALSNASGATIIGSTGDGAILDDDATSTISFTDFSDPSSLVLMGKASVTTDNRLRMTPTVRDDPGGALFGQQQFVATPFETTFDFELDGGHGFAFVIQSFSDTAALTAWRSGLGYDGMPNSLAVEFDTGLNAPGDPNDNHVSIHTRGTETNSIDHDFSLGSATPSSDLNDGNVHTAKITYFGGTMSVYVDDFQNALVSVNLDILDVLDLESGRAWVGFTASGTTAGSQDILNWQFTPGVDITTTIAIEEAELVESDLGLANMAFSVARLGDATGTVSVDWATNDGTATAGSDYNSASGQLIFAPGETQKQVSVSVNADTDEEVHETFFVDLTLSAGSATVADGRGVGTILNDDASIQISDATVTEGDESIRFIDRFVASGSANLSNPYEPIFGPDANADGVDELYVPSRDSNSIHRYDGQSGAFLDVFVLPGSGGLSGAAGIEFGLDGNPYVASIFSDEVHRFSGSDGSPLPSTGNGGAVFVSAGSGGLDNPRGLTFGPDGNLYVASAFSDDILRYDASSGEFIDEFVQDASGGLNQTLHDIEFGPDGNNDGTADLFVTAPNSRRVFRYDGATGAPLPSAGNSGADFVPTASGGLSGTGTLHFGPDGRLYVQSIGITQGILRYDEVSGAYLGAYSLVETEGPFATGQFAFGADGNVYSSQGGNGKTENSVARFGDASQVVVTLSLSSPSGVPVTVEYATADASALAGSDYTAVSGTITFAPGETIKTILVPTLDDTEIESVETFVVNLSNAVGANIADGQGEATINDDEVPVSSTKFYVVDASADDTFEYEADGTPVESYNLGAGNNAPRGAAATAAGDTVWVIDNDDHVYAHDADGNLLRSWKANGLSRPEGIATDGVAVWIVDRGNDRVHYYADGATRTTDTGATSSFLLAAGNPRGITTDGTSLWVVDTGTDRVYKYSLGGSHLGNWSIDGANSNPRGITIDPGNVDDVWIVDITTDRVYRYAGAATRTSGSQSAADSFALAGGNTNPQGIADPPPPSTDELHPAAISSVDPPLEVQTDAKPANRVSNNLNAVEPLGLFGSRPRAIAKTPAVWEIGPVNQPFDLPEHDLTQAVLADEVDERANQFTQAPDEDDVEFDVLFADLDGSLADELLAI